ncbi:MAG: 16S rRNA (guanine(527)-N(7))-methyltransferase RsmG [Coriobacteriia bacterium]|nr:16S rRNA (guanine(527)-N(7))-methyltransferase RsmG [Coriobacteriia bacterium]
MKQLTGDALLASLLNEAGIEISPEAQGAILSYLRALSEINTRINLTRIVDEQDAIRLHLVDSLLALSEVQDAPAGGMLDLGTGGGFPGVPLAVASGRHVDLLDSVAKKVRAVDDVLHGIGLQHLAAGVPMRAEELALQRRDSYSVVTARAVAELPCLVELASPLLATGGRLLAFKGSPSEQEVVRGIDAGKIVGMRLLRRSEFDLPGGGERRSIIVYEKVSRPRVALPRRVGLAKHSPLA